MNLDGSTNQLVKGITEAFDGGARNVEVIVIGDGADPADPTGVYGHLGTAYELLLNHPTLDILVPSIDNVRLDGTGLPATQNYGYQLANACYQATINRNSCIGVIGMVGPANAAGPTGVSTLSEIQTWVDALKAHNTASIDGADVTIYDGVTVVTPGDALPSTYAFWATADETIPIGSPPSSDGDVLKDKRNNPVDIGAYISVFASQLRYFNDLGASVDANLGFYDGSGAPAYAGLISSLAPHSATTNKPVGGAAKLRELSLVQADDLAKQRYVTVLTRSRGLTVTSGMTGAYNIDNVFRRSDFVRLSTVRVVHAALDIVRAAAEPHLGEPNHPANRNAMKAAVDESLRSMLSAGALLDYNLSISVSPAERTIGQISVGLDLEIALEIQTIKASISIS